MRSGTSLLNGTLYKKALSRWWPLAAAFLAANVYGLMDSVRYSAIRRGVEMGDDILRSALTAYFTPIFAVLMAMGVYRYLHSTRSAAFMSALPARRETVFLSHGLAGLTLLLLAEVLTAALIPLLSGASGVLFPLMLRWLGLTALLTLAYFGLASLCAVLTGHTLAVPALYAGLLYGAVAVEASLRNIAQYLIFGLGAQRWQFTVLSPVYYLRHSYQLISTGVTEWDPYTEAPIAWQTVFFGWKELISYVLAGLVCLVLAVVLLRKRPAEAAGDVIAVKAMRPLFRIGAALLGVCGAGLLLLRTVYGYSGYYAVTGSLPRVALLLFVMLLGGFIGWFGAEMLLRKSLRVFDRHWVGFGVFSALICLLVLGWEFDVFGAERQLPPADKVARVTVSCYSAGVSDTVFSEPENIAAVMELQKTVVANKARFEQGYDEMLRYASGDYSLEYAASTGGSLILRYFDENGRLLLSRVYVSPAGSMAFASRGNAGYYYATGEAGASWGKENPALGMLENLMNSPEGVAQRLGLPENLNESNLRYGENWGSITYYTTAYEGYRNFFQIHQLTTREAWDLYQNGLYPDSLDTSLGKLRLLNQEDSTLPALGNVTISLSLGDGMNQYWFWIGDVPADAHRTLAWLEDHGVHMDENGQFVSVTGNWQ